MTAVEQNLRGLLDQAFRFRARLLEEAGEMAGIRLFNGFWEGWPELAVDLYNRTLVLHGYGDTSDKNRLAAQAALAYYTQALAFDCAILKNRSAASLEERRGTLLVGDQPDQRVREYGVSYALNLRMHQDASLYFDTRLLRQWALEHLAGAKVLNAFAYTGSLGAAAQAAGAQRVIQTDLSREFLALAQATYRLNDWPVHKSDFIAGDFFSVTARYKASGALFDCVFLDPPFFSVTGKGRVDLNSEYARLVNKIRPLIGDGGWLVAVNNAVFVSGRAFHDTLNDLCAGGYMEVSGMIAAPSDFTGFNGAPLQPLPADPAPFNYSTKIALLRVRRKDGRKA